jgi:DNA-binding protein HU-beta
MAPVNKRDLAKAIAVQADVDLATVSRVFDGFTDVVTAVVSKGEPVMIAGFAKFSKVERAARMGRNPATGEQIRIKASKRVRVAPAKAFKDAVLSSASAPKLARGVWPVDADAVKRAGRGEPAAKAPAKAAPAKKTTAKKAVAKKAVAKKATSRTPAKKAPAKATAATKARATTSTSRAKAQAPARSAAKRVAKR